MKPQDLLPLSTPTYAILVTLGRSAMHGYGIIQTFEATSGQEGVLLPGSLYNTIGRMIDQGLIEEVAAPEGQADGRRRFYQATDFGRAVASAESRRLRTLLDMADAEGLAEA